MIALLIVLGLAWGSFLTALSDRIEDLRSLVVGRSKCPQCGHLLKSYDLIPVLSYLLLAGRCRYCKKIIGIEYLLTELFWCGILVGLYFYYGVSLSSLALFLSLSLLTVASINDIKTKEVALPIFIIGILLALAFRLLGNFDFETVKNIGLSCLVCATLPFISAVLSREKWMGYGDIFFALWMGVIVLYPSSYASIFIAFFSGALFGIICIALYGRKKENKISFGPFLALGTLVALFFGEQLTTFFLNLFIL